MVLVRAKVIDSTHLELAEPISVPQNQTVVVAVGKPEELEDERRQWLALSAQGLEAAYGEDEPDYSRAVVKEKNAEYEP